MRVFAQALRQSRRTIAVLSLASAAFYLLVLFAASAFLRDSPNIGFFRDPPEAIEAFVGGSADFLSPAGWLASALAHPIVLALLTAAGLSVAAGAVATEVERGTIDLVLTRPVGRLRFLGAKAAAALVSITVVEAGGFVGVLVARVTVEGMDQLGVGEILRPFLVSWVLFAALTMVGILASSRMSLRSRAIGASVGLIVGWYFLNFVAQLIDGISWLRFASPFHYFRPAEILTDGSLGTKGLALVALGVVALGAALAVFARRDLTR